MPRKKTEKKSQPKASKRQAVLDVILKEYGKEAVMDLSAGPQKADVISTGSIWLDKALGINGWPRGRIVELFGPEASGKTTLCLHAIAEAQKLGLQTAYIDAEHALDPAYASALGVDLDSVLLSQPECGEEGLNIAETLCRTGQVGLIVVDSVAALTPRAELEGEIGDSHVGLQARMMSQALRKMRGAVRTTSTTVIFINQIRMKIGVMFGSPETTPGGKALKYFASVRADVRRIGSVKESTAVSGSRTRVKVLKNKQAPPFKEAEFNIMFGKGVDQGGELLEFGVEAGVIEKSGAWFSFNGERLGQGAAKASAAVMERPDVVDAIREKLNSSSL